VDALDLARWQFAVTTLYHFAIALAAGFLIWTQWTRSDLTGAVLSAAAALALAGGVGAATVRREGWAFLGTAAAIVLATLALFTTLFPDVLPSRGAPANSLDVHNAAATPYTLEIMTWVAAFCTPVVLAYQAWTYWVFRRRLRVEDIGGNLPGQPADV
jgi:cytochrome d ubiquinol oxidase subunit II